MTFLHSVLTLLAELRLALRRLRHAPGYTLSSILMLGLGLGATTAMLGVVDSVLLRPVALPHPEQLVMLEQAKGTDSQIVFSHAQIQGMADARDVVESAAGVLPFVGSVGTADGSRLTSLLYTSGSYFNVLQVPARLGRTLQAADRGQPVAVVSDAFWRDNLHSDPHVIGSAVKVQGQPMTVVGVMPASFAFAPQSSAESVVCMPVHAAPSTGNTAGDASGPPDIITSNMQVLVRLQPGVPVAAAQQRLQAAWQRTSSGQDGWRLHLVRYSAFLTGDEQPALLVLFGACLLLLAIACANSANLQIARGAARMGEMRVRAALGASSERLLLSVAVESVAVSLMGAALGLALAYATVNWARTAYASTFARFSELSLHPGVFAACALLAIAVGLLAALAPGVTAARNVRHTLALTGTRAVARSRTSGVLVAAEVALTCVLLATAGLLVRSFVSQQNRPLGFEPSHLTVLTLLPNQPTSQSGLAAQQMDDAILARIQSVPGVGAVAMGSSVPYSEFHMTLNGTLQIAGRPGKKSDAANLVLASPSFIKTLGIPLLQGRDFASTDVQGGPVVALVNQAFAHHYLPGGKVLGSRISFPSDDPHDVLIPGETTVVGLVPDIQSQQPGNAQPTIYVSYRQFPSASPLLPFFLGTAPQFAVRSSLPVATLRSELRAALKESAPNYAEMQLQPMTDAMHAALDNARLATRLASAFSGIALLLAAIGLYGVLAYSVTQRTREIGIRMALGSTRLGAVKVVGWQAGGMAVAGIAVGLLGTWPAGYAVRSFLVGVKAFDPLTLLGTALVLLLVSGLASAAPAWRAARVEPAEALRTE